MRRLIRIAVLWCLVLFCQVLTVEGDVFTDSFDDPHDYLTDGVAGTGWDGFVGLGAGQTVDSLNASIDQAGQLFIQSTGARWEPDWNPLGPFLYKEVYGDFIATVKVTDFAGCPTPAVYHNDCGIMARVPELDAAGDGEDAMTVQYFATWSGNIYRIIDNGSETELGATGDGCSAAQYLQLERIDNDFYCRISKNGADWVDISPPVKRSDMDGLAVQIGLWQCTYSDSTGYAAFDDFTLIHWEEAMQARRPNPKDEATDVPVNVDLNWTAGEKVQNVNGHYVYIGNDFNDVNDANATSHPNVDLYVVSDPSCDVGLLELNRTYFWRVDEVNEPQLWKGEVWSFTTETGKAINPIPIDGTKHVDPNVVLVWTPSSVAASHDICFGTDENAVRNGSRPVGDVDADGDIDWDDVSLVVQQWLLDPPVDSLPSADLNGGDNVDFGDFAIVAGDWAKQADEVFKDNQDTNSYYPGPLDTNTVYYWRVDEVNEANRFKGDVWSFKTRQPGEYLINELFYHEGDPGVNIKTSEHFRIVYGDLGYWYGGMDKHSAAQCVLNNLEQCWIINHIEIGFPIPRESVYPARRDDNWYKTNVIIGGSGLSYHQGGGNWMGFKDPEGFAYVITDPPSCRCSPPPGTYPHEYGHVCDCHTEGGMRDNPNSWVWWESHANWWMLQYLESYPNPYSWRVQGHWYPGHGRNYYDNWHIFELIREEPGYGYTFHNRIFNEMAYREYLPDTIIRLNNEDGKDGVAILRHWYGDLARRSVTWDFDRGSYFRAAGEDIRSFIFKPAPVEPVVGQPGWYRISQEIAPMQFAHNWIGLEPTQSQVTVNFQGMMDASRGSDWRVCFVAVDMDTSPHTPRYSSMWSNGINSITMQPQEDELWLTVAATPDTMVCVPENDFRSDNSAQFPYEFSVTGATPTFGTWPAPGSGYHYHSNGGGIVANTATVDSTAYVGPNAMVLRYARVRNYARIEDYAVVNDRAQVRDNAIVRDHAMVCDSAQVYGNAIIADWAWVCNSVQVYGDAMVYEHAFPYESCKIYESARVKGTASSWGNSLVPGNAILDGDYADGLSVSQGVWFNWFNHDGYNPPDLGHLYCEYKFSKNHAFYAWDTHGANHGYKKGGASVVYDSGRGSNVLELDGSNDYVELRKHFTYMKDATIMAWIKWDGGSSRQKIFDLGADENNYMSLTPRSVDDKLRYAIKNGGPEQQLNWTGYMPSGQWIHLAVTLSGDTGRLCINGVEVDSGSITIDPIDVRGYSNCIGRSQFAADPYFNGRIDDFRIYYRALPGTEIASLYYYPPVPTPH